MQNKKNVIFIGLIVFAVLATFLIYKGCEKKDNVRFMEEYPEVGEDNVFTYRSLGEIIDIMEKGTGVVYLGFPECPWCQAYVKYLNDVAKEVGIEKIYYYNILEDRKNNTDDYQKVVSLLGENLEYDEEGKLRIYVPNVSFHIKGEVVGNDLETANDTKGIEDPKEYWTEERVDALKKRLYDYMDEIFIELNACSECNK